MTLAAWSMLALLLAPSVRADELSGTAFQQAYTMKWVALDKIASITLVSGRATAARRHAPRPQLDCRGTYCVGELMPHVVECVNKGSDGVSVQWICTAELSRRVKLGRVDVSCEGYTQDDDANVLVDSCGIEYELVGTGVVDEADGSEVGGINGDDARGRVKQRGLLETLIVVVLLFAASLSCMALCMCLAPNADARHTRGSSSLLPISVGNGDSVVLVAGKAPSPVVMPTRGAATDGIGARSATASLTTPVFKGRSQ